MIRTSINGVSVTLHAEDDKIRELNRLVGIINAAESATAQSDRDLSLLDDEFRHSIVLVLSRCKRNEFIMRPFSTLRSPWKQARLWRQSRTTEEIETAIQKLRREGAPFLAMVLQDVGPQFGRWATNALPGQSWHQWGLAVDCFLQSLQGRAVWAGNHDGYKCYAKAAKDQGLTAGYYWKRRDSVHVQAYAETVRALYTWSEIDAAMALRFKDPD